MNACNIEYLADHVELIPLMAEWFELEWPEWYGPDKGEDARRDLLDASRKDALPIGLVAFLGNEPVGIARLKTDSIPTHRHLTPWATAGLVKLEYRRGGIGTQLLVRLEETAKSLGYPVLYCSTARAASLLDRCGWTFRERTMLDGEEQFVYEKTLKVL